MPTSTPDSPQDSVPSAPDGGPGYGSFVVRWRRAAGERIELEHIQSGDRTRVSSPSSAVAWMRHRVDESSGDTAAPGPTDSTAPTRQPPAADSDPKAIKELRPE